MSETNLDETNLIDLGGMNGLEKIHTIQFRNLFRDITGGRYGLPSFQLFLEYIPYSIVL